jgi:hypothetical protein
MKRRYDDRLPSRRLGQWTEAHAEVMAWVILTAIAATLAVLAWDALIA